MGLKDLIITPIYLILFSVIAYFVRPYVTNAQTKKYFLPALWVRFAGAILLGVLYQFYYGGGDTLNYWEHGSKWIYEAFQEDVTLGVKLLLEGGGKWNPEVYKYTSQIWYYRDPASYAVVKLTAVIDLLTFHTYSASALFFAVFSFSGIWALYSVIEEKYGVRKKWLAMAVLFVPSVVFWGSGILKDTITLGALGWMTWSLMRLVEFRKRSALESMVLIVSFLIIYRIKLYILICYLPMVAVWLFIKNLKGIQNFVLRILIVPVLLIIFGISGFFTIQQITKESDKYALDNLAERARITAYDIRYGWGSRTGGDGGYDIGLPDGTWQSMIRLMPAGINVSLFRPYLWEVRNPLMLLSALEALIVFVLFVQAVLSKGFSQVFKDPFLVFCLGFSLLFAFSVGISTFNFGTLMRYKIPFMPFFLAFLLISKSKRVA
ncbi:hypothetical protein [Ekhidna sp.]|jgi:uncharacterized protein YneF (UPF0154 family)|uniref:hypothetical protein n=1 Tax=Ekhidna sp. TaxID=2608089 RepID=UPI0032EFE710